MKTPINNAEGAFTSTYNKVRHQLSKTSGLGFGFSVSAQRMKQSFREAMIEAHVPATQARVRIVNDWIARASKLIPAQPNWTV